MDGRYEEAYSYISDSDKKVKSIGDFKKNQSNDSPIGEILIKQSSFKILKVESFANDTALAEVELNTPDLSVIFKDIFGAAMLSAFGNQDSIDIEKALAEKYKNGEIPMSRQSTKMQMVQENDGWKVFFDWEKQKKIEVLLQEADSLREAKVLYDALDKYGQVLKLDGTVVEAQKAHDETKKEIKLFELKQAYLDKIVIYDLKAKYYDSMFDGRIPGVEFKLKNQGDRILNRVEVTVYFKDSTGETIFEEKYYPVLVSEYSFGDNKPLKPNYIWQLERGKFYQAKSVPDEWKSGAASARVTDLEFAEN